MYTRLYTQQLQLQQPTLFGLEIGGYKCEEWACVSILGCTNCNKALFSVYKLNGIDMFHRVTMNLLSGWVVLLTLVSNVFTHNVSDPSASYAISNTSDGSTTLRIVTVLVSMAWYKTNTVTVILHASLLI